MGPLDVISRAAAKNWLIVEDTIDDTAIDQLIATAIAWVETYTCYRLYRRVETAYTQQVRCSNPADNFPPVGSGEYGGPSGIKQIPGGVSIYSYPAIINSVKNNQDEDVAYTVNFNSLKILLYTQPNCTIDLTVGYDDTTKIPAPLVAAAYKLITYLYENRDMYANQLPTDVQMLINQYRRAII